MDRIIIAEYGGKKIPLAYTLATADFIYRKHGGVQQFIEALGGGEQIGAALDAFIVFNLQGIRKWKYERGDADTEDICLEPVDREELELGSDMVDLFELTGKMFDAIKISNKHTISAKAAKGAKKNEGSAATR